MVDLVIVVSQASVSDRRPTTTGVRKYPGGTGVTTFWVHRRILTGSNHTQGIDWLWLLCTVAIQSRSSRTSQGKEFLLWGNNFFTMTRVLRTDDKNLRRIHWQSFDAAAVQWHRVWFPVMMRGDVWLAGKFRWNLGRINGQSEPFLPNKFGKLGKFAETTRARRTRTCYSFIS